MRKVGIFCHKSVSLTTLQKSCKNHIYTSESQLQIKSLLGIILASNSILRQSEVQIRFFLLLELSCLWRFCRNLRFFSYHNQDSGYTVWVFVDIESEKYRKSLGEARFTAYVLVRLARMRTYKGRISFLKKDTVSTQFPPIKPIVSKKSNEYAKTLCTVQRTIRMHVNILRTKESRRGKSFHFENKCMDNSVDNAEEATEAMDVRWNQTKIALGMFGEKFRQNVE